MKIPDSIKTFGEAIRWARQKKGMTLRAFAVKVGVSAPFVSDAEHNRRYPVDIESWASYLGISVDDLRERKLSAKISELARNNPDLVAFLGRLRQTRPRCGCPLCLALLDDGT